LNAAAFVAGPRDGAGAALQDLARSLGFTPVERFEGVSNAEQQAVATPLVFFLCAAVSDVVTLRSMAESIRFSRHPQIRFAPLIYFARDPDTLTIKACIKMGFDDVIALPYGGGDLRERIFRQVGNTHVYYETATYFGPDRRNRTGDNRSTGSERGGGQHRRIEIVRSFEGGIDVLRDDFQIVV
jgi:PleD family two-component response regulator